MSGLDPLWFVLVVLAAVAVALLVGLAWERYRWREQARRDPTLAGIVESPAPAPPAPPAPPVVLDGPPLEPGPRMAADERDERYPNIHPALWNATGTPAEQRIEAVDEAFWVEIAKIRDYGNE